MIAVVSHDAGGAEIISSWVKKNPGEYCFVLEGPARSVFQNKLGLLELKTLESAVQESELVLCGTSWQSDLERKALKKAKSLKKKVVSYLDHWVNFKDRFIQDGELFLPDEIWVGDQDALVIAQKEFPDKLVKLVDNLYFEDIKIQLKKITRFERAKDGVSVLYICEPVGDHSELVYGNRKYLGYDEIDAINYFLKNIGLISNKVDVIKIRPHPSESKNKYDWVKRASSIPIEIGGAQSLIDEISASDLIVGCESMAMVIGLLAKRDVFSCIPFGGRACCLPQKSIKHLSQMVNASRL